MRFTLVRRRCLKYDFDSAQFELPWVPTGSRKFSKVLEFEDPSSRTLKSSRKFSKMRLLAKGSRKFSKMEVSVSDFSPQKKNKWWNWKGKGVRIGGVGFLDIYSLLRFRLSWMSKTGPALKNRKTEYYKGHHSSCKNIQENDRKHEWKHGGEVGVQH